MTRRFVVATVAAVAILTADPFASGRIGFYGIVEKVVFEPSEAAPERLQVWGAFMYVDGGASQNFATSTAKRGYLYFQLKSQLVANSDKELEMKKKEWADLKAVAGSGQAVGFGAWGYIAGFDDLQPDRVAPLPSYLYERKPNGGERTDLRVRPATEAPSNPATYQTETGVVKLSGTGSHASVVQKLREALTAR